MGVAVLIMLVLAMVGGSDATWCICRSDASIQVLQKTLDYACGAGADCLPIHEKGACFSPDTVKNHCSYAVNSYFQRKGQALGTCDFSGTAMITQSDPSTGGTCVYPSSSSNTPIITSPSTTTNTFTPTTPTTGVTDGVFPNVTPGFNTDLSSAEFVPLKHMFSFLCLVWFSSLLSLNLW